MPKIVVTSLRPYMVARTIEELRADNKVKLIETRQEGLKLSQLTNGIYGFSAPWMLNTDPNGVVGGTGWDKVQMSASRSGTAVLEIEKSTDGAEWAVVFINPDTVTILQNPQRKDAVQAILYHSPNGFSDLAVAIPRDRIMEWSNRTAGPNYVVDAVLK